MCMWLEAASFIFRFSFDFLLLYLPRHACQSNSVSFCEINTKMKTIPIFNEQNEREAHLLLLYTTTTTEIEPSSRIFVIRWHGWFVILNKKMKYKRNNTWTHVIVSSRRLSVFLIFLLVDLKCTPDATTVPISMCFHSNIQSEIQCLLNGECGYSILETECRRFRLHTVHRTLNVWEIFSFFLDFLLFVCVFFSFRFSIVPIWKLIERTETVFEQWERIHCLLEINYIWIIQKKIQKIDMNRHQWIFIQIEAVVNGKYFQISTKLDNLHK